MTPKFALSGEFQCLRAMLIFFFSLPFCRSLELGLKAVSWGRSSSSSSLATYLFFCWQALFCMAQTTCWCVAQRFICHAKWNFQSLCVFYFFLFFLLKKSCSSCTETWGTLAKYCPLNRVVNRFVVIDSQISDILKLILLNKAVFILFYFLSKGRKCFMMTNAALMRFRCGLHIAKSIV